MALSAAAAHARAVIDLQEQRLLDHLAAARHEKTGQLDNHMAACDLQVCDGFTNCCRGLPGYKKS